MIETRRVLIVGGGLAGLASASALAPRGFQVKILESRPRLGGRASSFTDAATGQMVDACQHVTMGCCTNLAHFIKTIGIDQFFARQPDLWFMTPDRRVSRFAADRLPAPLHLARSMARAHYLSWGDKLRIGWGMLALRQVDPHDDQPLLAWLKRNRQSRRTIERFWSVVLVSALNETIDRLGLKYARKVLVDGFQRHPQGFEVSLPTVPLGRLYGGEMTDWFARQGVVIETSAGVALIEVANDRVTGLQRRDGQLEVADEYISAVPWPRLLDLLPEPVAEEHSCFAQLRNLETSPIASVHLWFDRPVLDRPHLVLVDCLGHWIFNRGETTPGEHYLQVVVSAARSASVLGNQEFIERIVKELAELVPVTRTATILRSRVVIEHAATFSAVPNVDRWRPTQETPLANLTLAGDWTATGWPATMEGAVRSGYLAAEAILRRAGRVEQIIQPDLAPLAVNKKYRPANKGFLFTSRKTRRP